MHDLCGPDRNGPQTVPTADRSTLRVPRPRFRCCRQAQSRPQAARASHRDADCDRDSTEPSLQDSIIRTISGAQLVVADITDLRDGEHDPKRFNLDVCMEAAISYQAGTNLQLVAKGDQLSPPFMLRLNQMPTYSGGVELLALMTGTALRHRRRVINAEA
jgi:hypothetical protein